MNIIPCVTWIRRGVSKQVPEKIQLDKEDLKRVIEETREELDEVEDAGGSQKHKDAGGSQKHKDKAVSDDEDTVSSLKQKQKDRDKGKKRKFEAEEDSDDIVKKYGLEDYDETNEGSSFMGIGGIAYYACSEDDPYITIKDDSDSDNEDFEIKPSDNLIVAGRAEKDHCSLEVYVYNEEIGNLFVHHDYLLPSFPLAVEWMDFNPLDGLKGNFVAVGTMEPVIEVWDLDVVDCLQPVVTLGSKKKKRKKKKDSVLCHTDAVLDLSWNSVVRNVLASASADFTVGLWDLSEAQITTSITQHKEKVQCVQWHPFEAQSLLTGSFDQTAKVLDCRSPNDSHKSWNLHGEVERVLWDHFSPLNFFATTNNGSVIYIDIRQDQKPVFTLSAHSEAVTGLSLSSQVPGVLLTTSTDKTLKVWDVQDNKPSLVLERNLKMNELHCLSCCPEAPFVFAIGGEKELKVWDIRESAAVRNHFQSRMPVSLAAECEGDTEDIADDTGTLEEMETLSIDDGEQQLEQTHVKKKKKKKKKKKSAATE